MPWWWCGGGSGSHVCPVVAVAVVFVLVKGTALLLAVQLRIVVGGSEVAVRGKAELALAVVGGGAIGGGPWGADGDRHVSREASQLGQPWVGVAGAVDVCPKGARDPTADEAVVSSPGSVVCDEAEERIDGGVGPEGRGNKVTVAICKEPQVTEAICYHQAICIANLFVGGAARHVEG